jgi:hypothetical protein
MKTSQRKKTDSVVSGLNKKDFLTTEELIMVRGGEGTPDPIILPPNPPKKVESILLGGLNE